MVTLLNREHAGQLNQLILSVTGKNKMSLPVLAILGGTGDLGTGLARRWTEAGYRVIIGSRTKEKAQAALDDLTLVMQERGSDASKVEAMENLDAAQQADIVALTVPFAHHTSTIEYVKPALKGKILIDVTVPLVPPKVMRVQLPKEGSAGVIAQNLLGEDTDVVSAFQNIAAVNLQDGDEHKCDVLVCGNNKEAREQVITLVNAAGLRGLHAGSIFNSAATEALTSLLICVNKNYKAHASIRLTGVDA
jgi:NADPH-dependent F420 reductase